MREFLIEEKLEKNLEKIAKKDKVMYEAVMEKIEEIITRNDVTHYKNLKKPMQRFKRVHVKSSFILTFKYDSATDKVTFFDLAHHDNIYK